MKKLILPSEEVYPFLYETDKLNRRQVLGMLAKQLHGLMSTDGLSLEELELLV